ncbi:serine hydrolase domain-containing protein [Phytoactinopolyspora endophytica]|uniref:serine hydrolase domain-containing protein n=1 Tax=Phytoactinopolyspora endophytica TaxID=1642495 RepID=UPI00197C9F02|nr:serine hydrolase domain-containing protein [Phytoactinopolyspora endophytica]
MSVLTPDSQRWPDRLAELAESCAVPGAVLGISVGAATSVHAYGVTNVETGQPVTDDTLFQVGSITKVWTATALMRLVEDGKLDLDQPVVTYLPELELATPEATASVTIRHLLTHTSGIDGDFFDDFGRGDDCLERYSAALGKVPQLFPAGATWSYCNSGFVLAGRLIERLTGQVWDAAMRELLYAPLGVQRTVTLPEEAILHSAAVGHVHVGNEPPVRTSSWMLPRGMGPAGLISSTAADILAFARMHLAGGVAADGTRILSGASVSSMQTEDVPLPDPHGVAQSWGLGWFRASWGGTPVIGHDGSTIGQAAFLRLLPEHDLAVTLLTNGGQTRDLYESLLREVVRTLTGAEMTVPLDPPANSPRVDGSGHVGRYERTGVRVDVLEAERGLRLRITGTHDVPGLDPEPIEVGAVPVRDGLYVMRMPGVETWTTVTFLTLPDGTPCLHGGSRATPKVG